MDRKELATGLVISSSTPSYVGPIPTTGANGVKVDLLVLSTSTTSTVAATVETSNDLENWTPTTVVVTVTTAPAFLSAKTGATVTTQCTQTHARVKLTTTAGSACVTSGVSFFQYST